jgi:DNA-binding response OmpR family regulator
MDAKPSRKRAIVPILSCSTLDCPISQARRFCAELRMEPLTAQIPVVMITGKRDAAERARESEMELADILLKPVSYALLRQTVAGALETPPHQNSLDNGA